MGCPADTEKWIDGDKFFIQNLFRSYKDQKHFHSACLKELFFHTLNNNKRKNFIFSITKTRVPYLNGGLFDDDMPDTQEIDLPIDYFKDLFDFFEQYNFTIDENSPEEHEVGIDPEMLGHIFENLLEENREKGAFYTPKEIVHYMCQESLIQYLQTHLGKHKAIEDFVRTGNIGDKNDKNNFIVKNAKQIEEKLDDVKICDPAIGSGAFPMGILQEIFKAKTALDLTLDRAKTKKDIIQNTIYGVDIEKGAVDIARLRFWLALVVDEEEPQPLPNLDYKIMQGNSLLERYEGVDLSNLTDMDKEQTFFSSAFGQLELGSDFSKKKQTLLVFDEKSKKELYNLINAYFDFDESKNKNYPDKQFIKDQINSIVEGKLMAKFRMELPKVKRQIAEIKKQTAANRISNSDATGLRIKKEKNIEKLKKELETKGKELDKLNTIIEHLHELQDSNDKPYFLWHLWFKAVFDRGGFDIVIGNPPYIQLQKMGKDSDDLENAEYKTFTRAGDIYCLFYELGNRLLLTENGVLIYITSNKWMNAGYGINLRKYLIEETNPLLLIDFSKTVVFPAAVVFVNILMLRNQDNKNKMIGVKAQSDFQITKTLLSQYVKEKSVDLDNLNEDNWSVADRLDFVITRRIEEIGIVLKDWELEFFRGVTTGLNEVFHIDENTKDELIIESQSSEEVIKKLLRGKDIKRYKFSYEKKYLIFTKHGIEIEKFPAIKKYLTKYKKELTPKKVDLNNTNEVGRKPGSYKWYEIQDNTAYYQEFDKEKIIWIEISDRANYCLDTEGYYLTNSAYFITGKNLKYLLALLNSRLLDFYFFQKTAQIAGGRKRYTKQYVELLPIPQLDDEILIQKFEIIVEYLIYLNDATKPQVNPYSENYKLAPVFEDLLNMMVYELYFKDHMKEEEIDVLKYIDTEKLFKDLSLYEDDEKKKSIISNAYSKLQEQDNEIRNRIISSNLKSTDKIRRVNSTTH